MAIIRYLAALLIGLSLGLTGSGGSILTVPILVYLLGIPPVLATSYSLFVVGTTSLVGGFEFYRQGLVNFKTAFTFGFPSLLTVFFTRHYLVPAIPEHVFSIGYFVLTKAVLVMVLFALLMVLASYSMIKENCCQHWKLSQRPQVKYPLMIAEAMGVGLISGLVGAGGGFLIIPALVLFVRLDIKMAVGTSLVIIAANSLVGFVGDIFHYAIDWVFLLIFSSLSIGGIFIGSAFAKKTNSKKLKERFGFFILAMGISILLKEIFIG